MKKSGIGMIAFSGAPIDVFEKGREELSVIIDPAIHEIRESDCSILYFLSGGSEKNALEIIREKGRYILLAKPGDNSCASALEVKAWCDSMNIPAKIIHINDRDAPQKLRTYTQILEGIDSMFSQRLGLIGSVSDWLIASTPDTDKLKERLGLELVKIPWNEVASFHEYPVSHEFMTFFKEGDGDKLEDASRVYSQLQDIITSHNLDGITVECFPMVREESVAGCLPLALLMGNGIPAGCEGDIMSISSMMLIKSLTASVPWIVNVAGIFEKTLLLAHCTVPVDMIEDYSITSHFETGEGCAICGRIAGETVTIFRLNRDLKRAFITEGTIVNRPNCSSACRTQIEVAVSDDAMNLLKEHPLGNHHIVVPGKKSFLLREACSFLRIDVLS